ncbi:Conserved oligomeric Golgi complex subunit 7, partial [Frankliniella fusca]
NLYDLQPIKLCKSAKACKQIKIILHWMAVPYLDYNYQHKDPPASCSLVEYSLARHGSERYHFRLLLTIILAVDQENLLY